MPAENHVIEPPRAGQFPKSAFDNLPAFARKIYKTEQALREQNAQRYDTKTRRATRFGVRRRKHKSKLKRTNASQVHLWTSRKTANSASPIAMKP